MSCWLKSIGLNNTPGLSVEGTDEFNQQKFSVGRTTILSALYAKSLQSLPKKKSEAQGKMRTFSM